jgi:hypothetical protein
MANNDTDEAIPEAEMTDEEARDEGRRLAMEAILSDALADEALSTEVRGITFGTILRFTLPPLAAAALLMFIFQRWNAGGPWTPDSAGEVLSVSGDVLLKTGDAEVKAQPGSRLAYGGGLQIPGMGSARLRMKDGSVVRLGSATGIAFKRGEHSRGRLFLDHGMAIAEVTERRKPLAIVTPHATASVLGTRLRVMSGQNGSRIDVFEGTVRVETTDLGESTDATAGFYVVAKPNTSPRLSKSRIPKLSPKHGGIFFEKYAELYDTKGFALLNLPFEEDELLWRSSPDELLKAGRGDLPVTLKTLPMAGRDQRVLEFVAPVDSFQEFGIHPGQPIDEAVVLRFAAERLKWRQPNKVWRFLYPCMDKIRGEQPAGKAMPGAKLYLLRPDEHLTDTAIKYLLVGQLPDGRPVYERTMFINGKAANWRWGAAMPADFNVRLKNTRFAIGDIRLKRLKLQEDNRQ